MNTHMYRSVYDKVGLYCRCGCLKRGTIVGCGRELYTIAITSPLESPPTETSSAWNLNNVADIDLRYPITFPTGLSMRHDSRCWQQHLHSAETSFSGSHS